MDKAFEYNKTFSVIYLCYTFSDFQTLVIV